MNTETAYENSSFLHSARSSDFFSVCLPLTICLQRLQGCLPSKVRPRAWARELEFRLAINMFVHATDCRTSQWVPLAVSTAMINRICPVRLSAFTESYQPNTYAKTRGATMVASDSIMNFGVS